MLIVSDNSRNIYVVDIYMWNQRDKMSYFYDSYDTYDYDSTVTNYGCKCRLCHIVYSSTLAPTPPHTRTDAMIPEIVQLFSHFQ